MVEREIEELKESGKGEESKALEMTKELGENNTMVGNRNEILAESKKFTKELDQTRELAESKESAKELDGTKDSEIKTKENADLEENLIKANTVNSENTVNLEDCIKPEKKENPDECIGNDENVKKFKLNESDPIEVNNSVKLNKETVPYDFIFKQEKLEEDNPTLNIFQSIGNKKKKEDSAFLHKTTDNAPIDNKPSYNKLIDQAKFKGKLFYNEENEWIPIGDGEIMLKDKFFIFVRNGLKTVILNFPVKSTEFKKNEEFLQFKGKGKRSTNESFEIVERDYRVEFEGKRGIEEFLKEI
jgi:hypothetical protein